MAMKSYLGHGHRFTRTGEDLNTGKSYIMLISPCCLNINHQLLPIGQFRDHKIVIDTTIIKLEE